LESVKEKFKRLKLEIKHWYKEVDSNTKSRKRQLLAELEVLDQSDMKTHYKRI